MLSPLRLVAVARHGLLPLLLALPLAAPAAAATPGLRPVAGPRPLDRVLDCGSHDPSLAALAGGGFAAAWTDGGTLWWRRLDPTGQPLAEPAVVAEGQPEAPEVVALAAGGFAVVWFDRAERSVLVGTFAAGGGLVATRKAGEAGADDGTGFNGLDATLAPSGNLAVVWANGGDVRLRELRPDGTWVTDPWSVESVGTLNPFPTTVPALFDPTVVAGLDGAFRVFSVHGYSFPYSEVGTLRGRRVGPLLANGTYGFSGGIGVPATGADHDPDVARAADGGYLLAWDGDIGLDVPVLPIPRPALLAARFTVDDATAAEPIVVDESMVEYAGATVEALPGGGWAVAWRGSAPAEKDHPRAFARRLAADGTPLDAASALAPPASWGQDDPDLASGPGGLLVAAWGEVQDPDVAFVRCPGEQVQARAFQLTCAQGGTVCVGGGRFEMSLRFFDPRRGIPEQDAAGSPLTADTAFFWFTAPDNVEVVAKVLDGRGINGHYWVFYGALTDIGFALTVHDTVTGNERTFVNPPGEMASRGIVDALPPTTQAELAAAGAEVRAFSVAALVRDAFPGEGDTSEPRTAAVARPAPDVAALTPPPPPGPCREPSRPGLCLNGRRFNFVVTWRAFDGTTGEGHGVPLGDDSGYFWFFDPDNVELVIKALDGRAVNGKFWVFYGALTNVEYHLGAWHVDAPWDLPQVTYDNPLGHFASVADIDAFTPPTCGCPAVFVPVCGKDGVTYSSACLAYCDGWVEVAHEGACEAP